MGVEQRVTSNTGVTVTVVAGFSIVVGGRVSVLVSITVYPGRVIVFVSCSSVTWIVVGGNVFICVVTIVLAGKVLVTPGRVIVLVWPGTVTVGPVRV